MIRIAKKIEWINALDRQLALSHREVRDVSIVLFQVENSEVKLNFESLRKSDFVGNLSSDSYAIMLPECGIDEALEIAERCLAGSETNSMVSANAIDGVLARVGSWNHNENVNDFIERVNIATTPTENNIVVAPNESQPSKQTAKDSDEFFIPDDYDSGDKQ